MLLIDYGHMVEKLSAAASYPALCDSILPGTPETDPFGLYSTGNQEICHIFTELGISVQNRIAIWTGFREYLPQLLHNPGSAWMLCDIEMKDFAPSMLDDKEAI
jgi:hypothetical protein